MEVEAPIIAVVKKAIKKKIVQFTEVPEDTWTKEPYGMPLRREPDPTRLAKGDTVVPDALPPLPAPMPKVAKPQSKMF